MEYSILYRLVAEVPQRNKTAKEIFLLPQAYSEHRFSDHFIYGYRDSYVDVYSQKSYMPVLDTHIFNEVVEHERKFFLVRIKDLWGAYDFEGNQVRKVDFTSQGELIYSLKSFLN